MIFTETIHIHSFWKQPSKLDIKSDGAISAVAFYCTPELFVPFCFFDKLIDVLCKTARRPPLAKILQQSAQFRLIFFTVGTHIIKYFIRFVIKKKGLSSKVGYFFDSPSSLKLSLYIVMT